MDLIAVDTSALVAIIQNEPLARALALRLESAERRLLSAANYVELGAVLAGRGEASAKSAQREIDRLLAVAGVEVVDVTPELARLALAARVRFGKGFGAPAQLNFGDCFAYALAKARHAPLLYVGKDFRRTDLQPALAI